MAEAKGTASPAVNAGEGASSGGRVGAWTEAERLQLVLRVLSTLLPDGKGVEWKNISMPGRTLKAIQGQWTAIVKEMRDLNTDGEGNPPPKARTPRKKSTPKKAAAAEDVENADEDDNADDEEPKKPITPKKRVAAAANTDGSAKKRRTPAKKSAVKVEPEPETEAEAESKADENDEEH